ncbi:MAG: hypothetical protein OHK0013_01940 [Sandaracinaceae bacterium]
MENGQRKDYVVRGSRKDAVAFEARTRVELERSGSTVGRSRVAPRFLDFCVGTYRQYAEQALRPNTWKGRQYHIATLAGHLGDRRLTEIDTAAWRTSSSRGARRRCRRAR